MRTLYLTPPKMSVVVFVCFALSNLTGCLILDRGTGAVPVTVSNLKISVMSGMQPVAGASIQLYEANLASYTGASSARLPHAVTTDKNGVYTASTVLVCNPDSLFYLAATGGNAGGGTDSSIALMTAVGSCDALATSTIVLNEVTTVASVYALSGFMNSLTGVSTNGMVGTNHGTKLALTGLTNAFAAVNNLVDIHTGVARATTLAGNGIVPQAKINFMGNLLASCVESTGFTSTACTGLVANATPSGGTAPADTVQAMLNIAHSPGVNIAALYGLATVAAYAPSITAVPTDLTLSVVYTGTGTGTYQGLDVDGYGHIWVTAISTTDTGSVVEFSPLGTVLNTYAGGATGISSPAGIAIDPFNNVWVSNCSGVCAPFNIVNSSLTKIGDGGSPIVNVAKGTGYYYNSLHLLASDGAGDMYSAAAGPLQKLTNAGVPVGGKYPLNSTGAASFALDGSGNLGITTDYGFIYFYTPAGVLSRTVQYSAGAGSNFMLPGSAFDHAGTLTTVGSILIFPRGTFSTTISVPAGATMAFGSNLQGFEGIFVPNGVVKDGQGTTWIANSNRNDVSAFTLGGVGLSPSSSNPPPSFQPEGGGFPVGFLLGALSIAVDTAGNVWIPDASGTRVAEYVGAAVPVTPLAVGVRDNTVGQRP